MDGTENKLLTLKELAVKFRTSPRTLKRWIRTRALPCYKFGPRSLRFAGSEIDAWVSKQRFTGAPKISV